MNSWRYYRKKIKNDLIYILVLYTFRFINRIQRITALRFFTTLSYIAYCVATRERRKTIHHLSKVFGAQKTPQQIEHMAKKVFFDLARNMADAFRITTMTRDSIDSLVKCNDLYKIDQAMEKGRGILLVTGHIGSWELLAAYLAFKGYPLHVIGAPIYDRRLDELVIRNRTFSGAKYIARGGATRNIIRALRKNEMIGILMDQDSIKNEGIFVDFFGAEGYTPVGPIVLALKTGAVILPLAIHIQPDNTHVVTILDELELIRSGNKEQDIYQNTLRCSKKLEQLISMHPTQWVWMHERWKTSPADIARQKLNENIS